MGAAHPTQLSGIPFAILHPSASYRRGLGAALVEAGFQDAAPRDIARWLAEPRSKIVVVGDGTEEAIIAGAPPATTVVALIPVLEVVRYRRALSAGADGVAQVDTDPSIIADVVASAVAGEVVLPAEMARQLAGRARPTDIELTPEEQGMLQRLSQGATVVRLADEFYLSERSVRRRLQNVYLRLGVTGRAEALKTLGQLDLIE
jgi:DNA-binding NarL/FixJ family response regulator